jgi:methionyl aminopeptidase
MQQPTRAKSLDELNAMRASGRILAGALAEVKALLEPGITTLELDRVADSYIKDHAGIPSFLGVPSGAEGVGPFPATICASINDEIVHGIPSSAVLEEGDIISVDCGVILDGWHSDSARTFAIGELSSKTERLLDVTRKALDAAISASVIGGFIGDIGEAVQVVAEEAGFTVVKRFVGHGIGKSMHESPQVPNFGMGGTGLKLEAGTTLAIEPMVNIGSPDVIFDDDGWTARTADGSLSAHFEHTVAVTVDGPCVLTDGS